MTTNTDAAVEQCDRDAAADFIRAWSDLPTDRDDYPSHTDSLWVREGRGDSEMLVQAFARHRLATRQPSPTAAEVRERYRHKKRGTTYTVLGEAELQMSNDCIVEGSELTIYQGDDGKLWARQSDEFHDGRFEKIASTGDAPAATSDAEAAFRAGWKMGNARRSKSVFATLATEPPASTALREGHVATVPPDCDRIVWRGSVYSLAALASPTTDKGDGK